LRIIATGVELNYYTSVVFEIPVLLFPVGKAGESSGYALLYDR
jgi:hypothetical protein